MADKKIALHPINPDGSIDTGTTLFPVIRTDCIRNIDGTAYTLPEKKYAHYISITGATQQSSTPQNFLLNIILFNTNPEQIISVSDFIDTLTTYSHTVSSVVNYDMLPASGIVEGSNIVGVKANTSGTATNMLVYYGATSYYSLNAIQSSTIYDLVV